jgi:hypothetical protein
MPITSVDPSLAFGFYMRDREDFEDFCARVVQVRVNALFTSMAHVYVCVCVCVCVCLCVCCGHVSAVSII